MPKTQQTYGHYQNVTDPKKCQEICMKEPKCNFFGINLRNNPVQNNGCWLKSKAQNLKPREKCIFGTKYCNGKL